MPNFAVLTELNTLGKMDKFLYDSPELTFFRYQHMKTTNFAVDQILTPMSGNNNTRYAEIEREGDLALNCYLVVDAPGMRPKPEADDNADDGADDADDGAVQAQNAEADDADDDDAEEEEEEKEKEYYPVDSIGLQMINNVQLTIGNQCIERLSGVYMLAWDELSGGIKRLRGPAHELIHPFTMSKAHRMYIPLPFTFTKHSGAALPLIGLQFHAVKVTLRLNNFSDVYKNSPQISMDSYLSHKGLSEDEIDKDDRQNAASWNDFQFHLLTNQVYLDKEERNAFADYSNDILVEQVQERNISVHSLGRPMQLTYNHSISELIWCIYHRKSGEFKLGKDDNDEQIEAEGISEVSLKLNNHERFHALGKYGSYFRTVQPYQHHSNMPVGSIYCYNFGLKPEDAQPSGSINMSRIDNVMMTMQTDVEDFEDKKDDYDVYLWARNYNVLRIQNGMGGLVLTS